MKLQIQIPPALLSRYPFNPPQGGRVDETYLGFPRSAIDFVLSTHPKAGGLMKPELFVIPFNPPQGGRVDETPAVLACCIIDTWLSTHPKAGGLMKRNLVVKLIP